MTTNTIEYQIIFEPESTYEYRFNVLDTLINLYNDGINNLGLVAELNKSVCIRDDEKKTAKFFNVGF